MTVSDVAKACSIAEETVRRRTRKGMMPQPDRIGRAVRYQTEKIKDWVAAGCPDLSQESEVANG